jgi:hypothetical protein
MHDGLDRWFSFGRSKESLNLQRSETQTNSIKAILLTLLKYCWKSSMNHLDCCCSLLVITPGISPQTIDALDRIVVPKIKTKIVLTVGDYFKRVSYFSNFSNAAQLLAIP